jgi:metallophosphoesterase (TIGR00282 family)|tara:strand:- start:1966 stop:2772 length:807 start_codon:yes stop_codon:yes gene_type:complete
MNILILGDIMGPSGREVINSNLKSIINTKKIDFTIINGENSADDGRGITKEIANELFELGVDVITSGNHIWDKKETAEFILKEDRLLRPANLAEGTPGRGYGIYFTKNKKFKVAVINLMGNVFMRKTEDAFLSAANIQKKIILKDNVDFIVVDFHGEITSEKTAIGHFFDGKATMVVGTHTHIPTADTRILNKGTAYQTDIGMCGDYDSVIGMNKENSINKFLKKKEAKNHYPALGKGSLSGIIVEADEKTGLAKNIERIVEKGVFKK